MGLCRLWLGSRFHGYILFAVFLSLPVGRGSRRGSRVDARCFLGSDFLGSQKTAAWASGPPHGVFVARLVQVGLEKRFSTRIGVNES